jgi:hypothetical protein
MTTPANVTVGDVQIVEAIRSHPYSKDYAVATFRIARAIGKPVPWTYRQLIRMEKAGIVDRVIAWCSVNNIVWRIAARETKS